MTEKISGTEAKDYIDTAIEFIGTSWLKEEEKFYYQDLNGEHRDIDGPPKIVSTYHQLKKEIGAEGYDTDFEEAFFEETFLGEYFKSASYVELVNLGRDIQSAYQCDIIDENGVTLERDLQDIFQARLHGIESYDKARFEIAVGAYYQRMGYRTQFLDEDRSDSKTPDLRLDTESTSIGVECKKLDQGSVRAVNTIKRMGEVRHTVVDLLKERGFSNVSALIDFDRKPEQGDEHRIASEIPDTIDPSILRVYNLSFGKLFIDFLDVPDKNRDGKDIVLNQSVQNPKESIELFYDEFVGPNLQAAFGVELDHSETAPNSLTCTNIKQTEDAIIWSNPIWVGCSYPFERDFRSQLAHQIDAVEGKFERGIPNIVHIDLSLVISDITNLDTVRKTLTQKMEFRSRISCAVVSSGFKDLSGSPDQGTDIGMFFMPILNDNDLATPLPDAFYDAIWGEES